MSCLPCEPASANSQEAAGIARVGQVEAAAGPFATGLVATSTPAPYAPDMHTGMHSSSCNFKLRGIMEWQHRATVTPRLPGTRAGTLAGRKLGPWHDTRAGFERKPAGGRRAH
jgi:hypothetical protein